MSSSVPHIEEIVLNKGSVGKQGSVTHPSIIFY